MYSLGENFKHWFIIIWDFYMWKGELGFILELRGSACELGLADYLLTQNVGVLG